MARADTYETPYARARSQLDDAREALEKRDRALAEQVIAYEVWHERQQVVDRALRDCRCRAFWCMSIRHPGEEQESAPDPHLLLLACRDGP